MNRKLQKCSVFSCIWFNARRSKNSIKTITNKVQPTKNNIPFFIDLKIIDFS